MCYGYRTFPSNFYGVAQHLQRDVSLSRSRTGRGPVPLLAYWDDAIQIVAGSSNRKQNFHFLDLPQTSVVGHEQPETKGDKEK